MGAAHYLDVTTCPSITDSIHSITGIGAHAVVCAAGAPSAYRSSISLLRNCGTLVCVGIPPSAFRLELNPFELLVRGIGVVGSSVGNKEQMNELMKLASEGKIKPHIETFDFTETEAVMKRLEQSEIKGRAVVRLPE